MSPTYPIKGLDIMPMSKNASLIHRSKLQSIFRVDFGTIYRLLLIVVET